MTKPLRFPYLILGTWLLFAILGSLFLASWISANNRSQTERGTILKISKLDLPTSIGSFSAIRSPVDRDNREIDALWHLSQPTSQAFVTLRSGSKLPSLRTETNPKHWGFEKDRPVVELEKRIQAVGQQSHWPWLFEERHGRIERNLYLWTCQLQPSAPTGPSQPADSSFMVSLYHTTLFSRWLTKKESEYEFSLAIETSSEFDDSALNSTCEWFEEIREKVRQLLVAENLRRHAGTENLR